MILKVIIKERCSNFLASLVGVSLSESLPGPLHVTGCGDRAFTERIKMKCGHGWAAELQDWSPAGGGD